MTHYVSHCVPQDCSLIVADIQTAKGQETARFNKTIGGKSGGCHSSAIDLIVLETGQVQCDMPSLQLQEGQAGGPSRNQCAAVSTDWNQDTANDKMW